MEARLPTLAVRALPDGRPPYCHSNYSSGESQELPGVVVLAPIRKISLQVTSQSFYVCLMFPKSHNCVLTNSSSHAAGSGDGASILNRPASKMEAGLLLESACLTGSPAPVRVLSAGLQNLLKMLSLCPRDSSLAWTFFYIRPVAFRINCINLYSLSAPLFPGRFFHCSL